MKSIGVCLLLTVLAVTGWAQTNQNQPPKSKHGSISGIVLDGANKAPIVGASVLIQDTNTGAATDPEGRFTIDKLAVGNYILRISSVAHEPKMVTDVIVRSSRITNLEVELKPIAIATADIKVTAGYFVEDDDQPTSSTTFSAEEVRRAPGSAGDVSRVMHVLPSVARVTDEFNSLAVRGGNPFETGFYLDGVEIPNINHYPLMGTSGGPMGLINTDLIRNVTFSAGGFGASFGDKLSSVLQLEYREGNRKEFDAQLDMSLIGFGAVAEGPLPSKKGSWVVGARKSYLDLLAEMIDMDVAPRMDDIQGKIVYDLSKRSQLSLIGVFGADYVDYPKSQALTDGGTDYGLTEGREYALGASWRWLYSERGVSTTILSMQGVKYHGVYRETNTERLLIDNNSLEQAFQLRNLTEYSLSDRHQVSFGFDAKQVVNDYNHFSAEFTNSAGQLVPERLIDDKYEFAKFGFFANHTAYLTGRLTTTYGIRLESFEPTDELHVAPRFSLSYQLAKRTKLTGAAGLYYQSVPALFTATRSTEAHLKDPRATHFVLGVEQLLRDDTRLTVEGYYKKYEDFPLDPEQPELFILDETTNQTSVLRYDSLLSEGEAESYGVEFTLQKKLVQGIYGIVSGSLSKSRYKDFNGDWRNRLFDNRYIMTIEGGYKPNQSWEFSSRWIIAGGTPYTPIDVALSDSLGWAAYDITKANELRNPAYHSLNIRADRRFHYRGANLIVFLSVWNVYDRKNVAARYWDAEKREVAERYQWRMVPILGLEYEF